MVEVRESTAEGAPGEVGSDRKEDGAMQTIRILIGRVVTWVYTFFAAH